MGNISAIFSMGISCHCESPKLSRSNYRLAIVGIVAGAVIAALGLTLLIWKTGVLPIGAAASTDVAPMLAGSLLTVAGTLITALSSRSFTKLNKDLDELIQKRKNELDEKRMIDNQVNENLGLGATDLATVKKGVDEQYCHEMYMLCRAPFLALHIR